MVEGEGIAGGAGAMETLRAAMAGGGEATKEAAALAVWDLAAGRHGGRAVGGGEVRGGARRFPCNWRLRRPYLVDIWV